MLCKKELHDKKNGVALYLAINYMSIVYKHTASPLPHAYPHRISTPFSIRKNEKEIALTGLFRIFSQE